MLTDTCWEHAKEHLPLLLLLVFGETHIALFTSTHYSTYHFRISYASVVAINHTPLSLVLLLLLHTFS